MDTVKDFFDWFRGIGGRVPDHYKPMIEESFREKLIVSSFSNRAEEIKQKYNHKFIHILAKKDFLEDVPDIDKIYFEKKE